MVRGRNRGGIVRPARRDQKTPGPEGHHEPGRPRSGVNPIPADRPLTPAQAARALADGEILILPTETVYGLAADARNPAAIRRLFVAKGRPPDQPIASLVRDARRAFALCSPPPALRFTAEKLATFWPGPLTILLPHNGGFPEALTVGSPLAGLRVPDHPVTLAVLADFDGPVAATSANQSGQPPPATATEAVSALAASADLIYGFVDGGPAREGRASTVVRLAMDDPGAIFIVRAGTLAAADFERKGIRVLS